MKIIFSRKAFDSSAGGCASPVFEDGSMVSLPIPHRFKPPGPPPPQPPHRVNYSDVSFRLLKRQSVSMGKLVEDLSGEKVKSNEAAHLDPDLREESLERKEGWRPMFGQADAAQRHLDKYSIGKGDLFLFFGWFRRVEERDGKYRFKRGEADLHVLYGWLEVGDKWVKPDAKWMMNEEELVLPDWAHMHPHVAVDFGKTNTIYPAAMEEGRPKAGVFKFFSDSLVLTAPERSRSVWKLPLCFMARNGMSLSYHLNPVRWEVKDGCIELKTVGRGQEFVLDAQDRPEAIDWARDLIKRLG